ncbi:MBL fold metallo-hydrolase [Rheinheimera sp. UJ63]|uniref:MBL fold metallo-hydrolase n=1 Tax=Rheinheimera sp. UJ63 TaxID=2910157 RepID=UPI001F1A2C22|nr:MBL fold metallo-hydrolase [Rheinheimera sp. UJ63]MCF4009300.1 MBL fold metallo-hydrolase [Rheinheimera sp. UJ63]
MTKLAFPPTFIHHGAVNGVTGSCHEYQLAADYAVLIDCGLFQGDEQGSGSDKANLAIQFPILHIQALIVTHVHIDHVGRIPYLLAAGFTGPIYCSIASAHLLPLVLEDALKVGVTRDEKLIAGFLRAIGRQLVPCEYKQWLNLPDYHGKPTGQFRLQKAGHILGSAYVEIKHYPAASRTVQANNPASRKQPKPFITVFSGDLGAPYSPLLVAPKPPYAADVVVIESTYGDKLHDDRRLRVKRLEQVLLHSLQDNGTVLFPAFSIGRTQELVYELECIIHRLQGQKIHQQLAWQDLTVIIDSPLAAKFTTAFQQLLPCWNAEARSKVHAGRHPLSFAQLHTIDSHAEHLATVNLLASTRKPAIVIAASGMCEGGRVVNYLKALLPDAAHQLVFVGYQARGTLGAAIQQYGPRGGYVMIAGERIDIQAEVLTLSGYSAHADKKGLIQFIKGMRHPPQQVRIVHGDNNAKLALQQALELQGIKAIIA